MQFWQKEKVTSLSSAGKKPLRFTCSISRGEESSHVATFPRQPEGREKLTPALPFSPERKRNSSTSASKERGGRTASISSATLRKRRHAPICVAKRKREEGSPISSDRGRREKMATHALCLGREESASSSRCEKEHGISQQSGWLGVLVAHSLLSH